MSDGTKIEWTDASWNPITGCSVVSPGCANCYAMRLAGTRLQYIPSRAGLTVPSNAGPVWNGQVRFNEQWLDQPLRWKRPRKIFVCAHGDLFHKSVPDEWIDKVFAVMAMAPQHIFQVLTKRAARMRAYFQARREGAPWAEAADYVADLRGMENHPVVLEPSDLPLPNVWLGVSVEDQQRADERIPDLMMTPAALRWISAEPLLGSINLSPYLRRGRKSDRAWSEFIWPTWVPQKVRLEIEGFWRQDWNRGPDAWLRSSFENGHPSLGTFGRYAQFRDDEPLVEGRFVHAWNNIGRVVSGAGEVKCVSAGRWQVPNPYLDWIVAGGESGPGARPMHPDWARSLRDQCDAAHVPFFFKQHGSWIGIPDLRMLPGGFGPGFGIYDYCKYDQDKEAVLVGKRTAGRLLDGVTRDAMPGSV